MPTLIVLCGFPGTGKTTATCAYKELPDWFIYSTDDYLEMKANEFEQTYNDVFDDYIKESVKVMDKRLEQAIELSQSVIWDQTNLSKKKRQKVLSKFLDYHKICWYFPVYTVQYGKWFNRLAERTGKTVPMKVIRDMIKRVEIPSLDEDFHEIVYKETGL